MKEQTAYDSYGFRTSKLNLAVEAYLQDPEQEKLDTQRWNKLLPSLSQLRLEDEKKLMDEVRKGVPTKLRAKIWSFLIIPPLKQYNSIKVGQELKQIDRDIGRTIPTNKRDKQIQDKLKTVLNVLAVAFPEMGYCQGLNFITGNLLLIMNPEQTYNTMFHILYWQRHEHLMTNMDYIHQKIFILDKLIKKHYPKLFKTLENFEVETLLFACSWFVTLFNNILPCQYAFRVLEMYFLEGEKIIYRTALQILKEKKKILKKMSEREELIAQLKNYEEFNKGMEPRFFHQLCQIKITKKELEDYESEYNDKFGG